LVKGLLGKLWEDPLASQNLNQIARSRAFVVFQPLASKIAFIVFSSGLRGGFPGCGRKPIPLSGCAVFWHDETDCMLSLS
jgi:hypothetical protein